MTETRISIEKIYGKNDPSKDNVTFLVNAWQVENGEPCNGDTFHVGMSKESDKLEKDENGRPKYYNVIVEEYERRISETASSVEFEEDSKTYI